MIALLLILVPLLGGIATFFIKKEGAARSWSLFATILTFIVAILGVAVYNAPEHLAFKADWMSVLNSSFSIKADGMGMMLCMLTAMSFPLIFVSTWNTKYSNAHNFFGLMLLSQAGLMGVFLAMDALLFYFFWELALIPIYFLCSMWGGGQKRIRVMFKFFVYTFLGSLLMLVGLIYIYSKTNSFDISAFYSSALPINEQTWLFWLLFIAFAVKIPVFPFHTWQPDTYEQAPTSVTMVLSAIMVKMGVLSLLRWLLPVLPLASYSWGDTVSTLGVIGIVYASLIAFRQDDMKRLVAYSSIAHMGLMVVAVFAETQSSIQGVLIQMFSHGVNILGLWIVIEIIERKFGTRKMSELGGVAQKAPALTIGFYIIMLANISLPLTNSFIGEFLMFNGIFSSKITQYATPLAVFSMLGVVMAVVYSFRMARKVFLGNTNVLTDKATDISFQEKAILGVIVAAIIIVGVYPQPFLDMMEAATKSILKSSDVLPLLKK